MPFSQREKKIGIGVGVAVGLLFLDLVVYVPYSSRMDDIDQRTADAERTQDERTAVFNRQPEARRVWADLTRGGLSADPSAAESLALEALSTWTRDAGVGVTAVKEDAIVTEAAFQVIGFHITAAGPTPAIGRLLADLEQATVPVRVTDVQLTPRKEGTDELQLQFGVSTLCLKPDATKPPAKPAGEDRT